MNTTYMALIINSCFYLCAPWCRQSHLQTPTQYSIITANQQCKMGVIISSPVIPAICSIEMHIYGCPFHIDDPGQRPRDQTLISAIILACRWLPLKNTCGNNLCDLAFSGQRQRQRTGLYLFIYIFIYLYNKDNKNHT